MLEMNFVKTVVSLGLAIRKQKNIAVKQPLSSINIVVHDADKKIIESNRDIILEELNIKNIGFIDNIESIAKKIANNRQNSFLFSIINIFLSNSTTSFLN